MQVPGRQIIDFMSVALSSVQDGDIQFSGLDFDHVLESPSALSARLNAHYMDQLTKQALRLGASQKSPPHRTQRDDAAMSDPPRIPSL